MTENDHFLKRLIPLMMALVLTGCYTSRSVIRYGELVSASNNNEPIRVLTVDSTLHTFTSYTYTDSTLMGSGSRDQDGVKKSYRDTLTYNEIVFVERLSENNWKALWMIPMSAIVVGGAFALLQPSEFEIWRTEGGSCPYLYSYDGSKYVLEAEAFSTAISKALETETYHVLPSLKQTGDQLKVRIANERPETHLFNRINLYAVEAGKASSVVLDIQNNAWPVYNEISPQDGWTASGKRIVSLVAQKDEVFWQSELDEVYLGAGFRDTLDLEFKLHQENTSATLIVDAINSDLINEVYAAAGVIIGEESLMFYHALENEPALQQYFKKWIEKSSLLVEVQHGEEWVRAGHILPEANEVSFRRALRLEDLKVDTSSGLRIRLSSMMDVWQIDAVTMDTTMVTPLEKQVLDQKSMKASNGNPMMEEAIRSSDFLYALLMPPDHMEIIYEPGPAQEMQKPVYILSAQGYLYEWFPKVENTFAHETMNEIDRVELLPLFSEWESTFLYAIYRNRIKNKGVRP